jgi:1-deoxy-D-xylulose-5-phosphate reductoisomerase
MSALGAMPKQRVTILGSTGSIGANTLDVIARHPDRYEVFALSAMRQVDKMLAQCLAHTPRYAVMAEVQAAHDLQARLKTHGSATRVLAGAAALDEVAAHPDCDSVMAAIVGAAGLSSCLAAARAGKRLMLANKEALVVGGELFMQAVREGGALLLPIDSEHSAVFQSLPQDRALWADVDKIILTASGGPFRSRDPATLREVTPEQAVAHPNWVMGRKISVDSATMMNKALEVIEAKYLFDVRPQQIEVVIHPQSIIHSMVQFKDNSTVAQLGTPDMRVPIAYGLSWPTRVQSGAQALDWCNIRSMTFEVPDHHRFPGLQLAWDTLRAPLGATAVLNAANEVAVQAFLDGQIRFDQIHALNAQVLTQWVPSPLSSLDDLLALDAQTRHEALSQAKILAGAH